jgi:hypothetical protein
MAFPININYPEKACRGKRSSLFPRTVGDKEKVLQHQNQVGIITTLFFALICCSGVDTVKLSLSFRLEKLACFPLSNMFKKLNFFYQL